MTTQNTQTTVRTYSQINSYDSGVTTVLLYVTHVEIFDRVCTVDGRWGGPTTSVCKCGNTNFVQLMTKGSQEKPSKPMIITRVVCDRYTKNQRPIYLEEMLRRGKLPHSRWELDLYGYIGKDNMVHQNPQTPFFEAGKKIMVTIPGDIQMETYEAKRGDGTTYLAGKSVVQVTRLNGVKIGFGSFKELNPQVAPAPVVQQVTPVQPTITNQQTNVQATIQQLMELMAKATMALQVAQTAPTTPAPVMQPAIQQASMGYQGYPEAPYTDEDEVCPF